MERIKTKRGASKRIGSRVTSQVGRELAEELSRERAEIGNKFLKIIGFNSQEQEKKGKEW